MIQKIKEYTQVVTNVIEVVDNKKIATFILVLSVLTGYLLYANYAQNEHIKFLNTDYQNKILANAIIHKEDMKECNQNTARHIKDAEMWKERLFQYLEKNAKKK